MSEVVRVYHMKTGAEVTFTLPPRSAVIAAYAQARDDWNTWNYEEFYGSKVEETDLSFILENWSCQHVGYPFLEELRAAALALLDKLDNITTEDFSRGGEQEQRERLRELLLSVPKERS